MKIIAGRWFCLNPRSKEGALTQQGKWKGQKMARYSIEAAEERRES